MTKKFNRLIEEMNRRGFISGLVGSVGSVSSSDAAVPQNKDDFIHRVENLVTYLETGKQPKEPVAMRRGEQPIQNFDEYQVSWGNKNMGVDNISAHSYWELDKQFKGAKGKYQIIPSTFKDLENNGLYRAVPSAKNNFSPDTQNKIFQFMKDVKYNFKQAISSFMAGDVDRSIWWLSREWASIPKDKSNESYYNHDGTNKALASFSQVRQFLMGEIPIDAIKKR